MALPPLEGEINIKSNAEDTFASIASAALTLASQLSTTQVQAKSAEAALQSLQATPVRIQFDESDFEEAINEVEVSVEEAKKRMEEAFGRDLSIRWEIDPVLAQGTRIRQSKPAKVEVEVELSPEARDKLISDLQEYYEAATGGSQIDFTRSQQSMESLAASTEQAIATLRSGREGIAAFQEALSQIDPEAIIQLSQADLTGIVPQRAMEAANELQGILGEVVGHIVEIGAASQEGLRPMQQELQKVPALLDEVDSRATRLSETMRNLKGFRPEDISQQDFTGAFRTVEIQAFLRELGATPGDRAAQAVEDFTARVTKLSRTMEVSKAVSVTYREQAKQLATVFGDEMPSAISGTVNSLEELEKAFGRVKKVETIDPAIARREAERSRAVRFRETAQAMQDQGYGQPGSVGGISRGSLSAAGQLANRFAPGATRITQDFLRLSLIVPEVTAGLSAAALAIGGVSIASAGAAAAIVGIVIAADRLELVNRQAQKLEDTFGDAKKAIDTVQDSIGGRASRKDIKPILLTVDSKSALAELSKFTAVSEVVQQRADELGTTWAEAMPKVVQAIQSGNYSQLEQLGLLDSSQRAFAVYAQELGTTTDKLSDAQREQAILDRVIEEFDPKPLEDKTTSLGRSYQTLATAFKDATSAGWKWFITGTAIGANNAWEKIFGKDLDASAESFLQGLTSMFRNSAEASQQAIAEALEGSKQKIINSSKEVQQSQAILSAAQADAAALTARAAAAYTVLTTAQDTGTQQAIDAAQATYTQTAAWAEMATKAVEAAEATHEQAIASADAEANMVLAGTAAYTLSDANDSGAEAARTFSDALADLAISLDRVQQGANSSALSIASRLVPSMGISGAMSQAKEWQGQIQQIRDGINQVNEEAGRIVLDEEFSTMAINAFSGFISATTNDTLAALQDTGDEAIAQGKRIKSALDGALTGMAEGVTKPSTAGLLSWDLGSLKSKMDKEGTNFADAFGMSFEDAVKKYGSNIDLIALFTGREDEVDEKARRLGTVLVSGLKSEYIDQLREEGIIPQDVLDKGEMAVRKFAAGMLKEHERGFVPALYDQAKVAEKVFDQIQTKAKRNDFMKGVIAQVKELGATADDLDIYDALGIDTTSERSARKMTADMNMSFTAIMGEIQAIGSSVVEEVSKIPTPADKMADVSAIQSTKLKLAGGQAAKDFGEQMVVQTTQGKYGDRSVDQMLLEVDARQEDVEKRGRVMGGWMGTALVTEFSENVPPGLIKVLVSASAPSVYAKVMEMMNDR